MNIQIFYWLKSQDYGNSDFEIVSISLHQTEGFLYNSSVPVPCNKKQHKKLVQATYSKNNELSQF